ncbi:5635_t:CDS:2 [Gigaspora margarita]|uniref:5635_t:CDS:1 n=1 Tax=Gigaspora margarita TaxID=4874 RepID=A0ABN7V7M9_GIGMA|nr:5635_t:CDS:2 [Gigaspora margarita]
MSTNKLIDTDNKKFREKKFIILSLKEEWEKAEKSLAKRKTLSLVHASIASLTIIIGTFLFLIFEYNATNKILIIVTSSVTASGGILTLIKAVADKASTNNENVTKMIQALKFDGKEDILTLVAMEKNELKELKMERHENYIKFLNRINFLIGLENKFGILFAIVMSLFIVNLAVFSIFENANPQNINIPLPKFDRILTVDIIVSGVVWLINILLSNLIEFYELVANFHWGSFDDKKGYMRIGLQGFLFRIFLAITHVPLSILLAPLSIYYWLMKRIYVLEKEKVYDAYFGEFKTKNDDVTFFGTEMDTKLILVLVCILKFGWKNKFDRENPKEKDWHNICDIGKYLHENEIGNDKIIIYHRLIVILATRFLGIIDEKDIDLIEKSNVDSKFNFKLELDPINFNLKLYHDKNSDVISDEISAITVEIVVDNYIKTVVNKKLAIATIIAKKIISGEDIDEIKDIDEKKNIDEKEDTNVLVEVNDFIDVINALKLIQNVGKNEAIKQIEIISEFEKYKTENDDEAMKIVMKIIEKNLVLRRESKIRFKIEDIELTKRHKQEIKRLLCGLEHPIIALDLNYNIDNTKNESNNNSIIDSTKNEQNNDIIYNIKNEQNV